MNIADLHPAVWKALNDKRQRMPHAILLSGQGGIGKLELAERFAAALLCESPLSDGQACGNCSGCRWHSQGNHPDFRRVQPAADLAGDAEDEKPESEAKEKKLSRDITVAQIRALDDFMHVGTHRHGLRVLLLEPAEAMNAVAANALLKTLEEPAAGTVFLLVSDASEHLLPTIRSRCQALPVPRPEAELAQRWLAAQGIADPGQWLALAGGAPRLAVALAAGGQGELLGVLTAALALGADLQAVSAAAQIERLVKAEKRDPLLRQMVEWLQRWCHDLALAAAGIEPRYFLRDRARIAALAGVAGDRRIIAFSRKTIEFKRLSEHPLNTKLFLEDLLTEYASIFARGAR